MSEFKIRPGITDDEAKEILELNKKASSIQECRDNFIKVKYKEYGLETEHDFLVYKKCIEKGISYINGKLVRHVKGRGSGQKRKGGGDDSNDKKHYERKPYNLEDIHAFNYDEILLCEPDKKYNCLMNREFNQSFYNINDIITYQKFTERYYKELENGKLNKMNDFVQRLSTYIKMHKLSEDSSENNYIDGSVICNIALMLSKYMQTDIYDTDLHKINKMSIEEMNEENNIYYLFLLIQIFTCKYKYKQMYVNGKFERDWWAICLIRRRITNNPMKTKGVLPRITKDKYGNIVIELY